jgi:hypothetical protein
MVPGSPLAMVNLLFIVEVILSPWVSLDEADP